MRSPIRLAVCALCALTLSLILTAQRSAYGQLIISEFRLHGTGGPNDEFIEIYNNSGADHTVNSLAPSSGYAVAASDGAVRFTIPSGTVIPAGGHYLGCNNTGYSLSGYPAGNGTTATCDATYTPNIPNGEDPDGAGPLPPLPRRGIALFKTTVNANLTLANRMDAVGPTEEADPLYKEGTGVRNLTPLSTPHSCVRRRPGGCIGTDPGTVDANCINPSLISTTPFPCPNPQDTKFLTPHSHKRNSNGTGSQKCLPGRKQ